MISVFNNNFFIILICLFIINIIFLYFYSYLGKNIGLVDIPNNRKTHIGEIPLVGGLSIYSSLFLFFLFVETNHSHKIIFLSSLIVFLVSLYDDKFNLGITERLFFQIIACLIIAGFGIRIFDIGDYLNFNISLGGFGILLTFVCMIAYMNAINFSDGLDGLAAGYILNCLISIIFFSYLNGYTNNLEPLIFLIVILIGFVISNIGFIIPKTFLGDSGSTSMGFIISCYLIYFTMPENRYFHPVLTLWAAPLPTLDFLTVFTKRIISGSNPFKPDRRHIHYLLTDIGLSKINILISLLFFSTSITLLGIVTALYFGAIYSLILFIILFFIYLYSKIKIMNHVK